MCRAKIFDALPIWEIAANHPILVILILMLLACFCILILFLSKEDRNDQEKAELRAQIDFYREQLVEERAKNAEWQQWKKEMLESEQNRIEQERLEAEQLRLVREKLDVVQRRIERERVEAAKTEPSHEKPESPSSSQPTSQKVILEHPEYVEKVYRATGMEHRLDNLMALSCDNSDYDLPQRELVDNGLTDERIFQKSFYASKIELVPEPDNPYDKNAIKVVADGRHIAYIKSGSCAHLLKVIREGRLLGISADIGGGQYKYVYLDEDDDKYTMDRGSVRYFVHLTIKEKIEK